MKSILVATALLITNLIYGQLHPSDTVAYGVQISFASDISIFPESWQVAPINAVAESINPKEIARCKKIVVKALRKYTSPILKKDLKTVYFIKTISFYDVPFGGTNSNDALYLSNNGIERRYTDLYMEQNFHHEFSSILYRNHPELLDEKAWAKANVAGFDYSDPEAGVGAIRENKSSQEFDTALCRLGFLTQYSLSGMENDINTFAQNLFSPSEGFWELVDQYPRIRQKFRVLLGFYNSLDPVFTENYFRKMAR